MFDEQFIPIKIVDEPLVDTEPDEKEIQAAEAETESVREVEIRNRIAKLDAEIVELEAKPEFRGKLLKLYFLKRTRLALSL